MQKRKQTISGQIRFLNLLTVFAEMEIEIEIDRFIGVQVLGRDWTEAGTGF